MSTKLNIVLPHGGPLAAAGMGTKEDVPVDPHTPIMVPEAYARSLIENRFAHEVPVGDTKPEKGKRKAKPAPTAPVSPVPGDPAPIVSVEEASEDDGEEDSDTPGDENDAETGEA